MDVAALLVELYDRIPPLARRAVDGLEPGLLTERPGPGANTVGWLIWHLARVQDHHLAEVSGVDQVWVGDGWAARFGLDADPSNTGYGHSMEEVASVRPDSAEALLSYLETVSARSRSFLEGLVAVDLDRVVDRLGSARHPRRPPGERGRRLLGARRPGRVCARDAAALTVARSLIEVPGRAAPGAGMDGISACSPLVVPASIRTYIRGQTPSLVRPSGAAVSGMRRPAVCDRLGDLTGLADVAAGLRRLAAGFDASLLSADDAGVAVAEAAAIEAMAALVKALAAARVAEAGVWKAAGERSAAHHLARRTGTSVSGAGEVLETARRLGSLPVVAAAARSGHLSAAQVGAVADAAAADPSSEARLVETAGRSSLAELRDECARTKAAAHPDPEARRRAIHASRFLRAHTDAEGAWHLRMRDNPEVGAEIMAAIAPIRDRLFDQARAEGRHEEPQAYAADALAELARGHGVANGRGRAKIVVRIDLAALLRGRVLGDEVCEIAGFGPVAVSAVRDLIETGDPFLAAVVTRGRAVVGVAHLRRRPTALQQSALEWLYPTCAVEGCSATTWLENDHRVDWAASGLTVLDLLDRLCTHHHDRKSLDGWGLVPGHGKRPFVPPDDPRHPRHAAHAPPSAA